MQDWVLNNTLAYFMDNFTNNGFSVIRHKTYSEVPNMPLQMKEDAGVAGVREDSSGSFNELSGSDDVDEESNSSGVMLGKAFVDIFGILDV
jgi:hypothetical protein